MQYSPKIEILKNNLLFNYESIRRSIGEKRKLCLTLKSNAYGHGVQDVLRALKNKRVDYWGVSSLDEAKIIQLWNKTERRSDRILFYLQLIGSDLERAIEQDCEFIVGDLSYMREIVYKVEKKKKKTSIHVHLDTGMGRLGLLEKDFQEFSLLALSTQNISIVGLCSHFLDSSDTLRSKTQMNLFHKHRQTVMALLNQKLKNRKIIIHVANTGALLWQKQHYFDMLRIGMGLYGSHVPGQKHRLSLKPVMKLTAYVARIKRYPAGHGISYNSQYTTKKASNIAVVNIGYGLGLPKSLTNRGKVLIHNKLYSMVGNVTMDMCMVNLGDDQVRVGDAVVFWGDDKLCLADQAKRAKMIPYELVCTISPLLKRTLV